MLVDSGWIVGLFDRNDQHHHRAVELMESIDARLHTTWPVLTEACHLLDFHPDAALDALEWLIEARIRVSDQGNDLPAIRAWMSKYRDTPMDLADASLMRLAEQEGITQILSFDSHFDAYRLPDGRRMMRTF
jgi:hypothetical protein